MLSEASSAGCMVIKIPINSTATSWIAPQVKWFLLRTLLSVVLNDRNAARRIITISISAGNVSVTSPKMWIPITSPAAFWNAESPGSTPLRITAATIIIRKIMLCSPSIWNSVPGLLISGLRPCAMSLRYAQLVHMIEYKQHDHHVEEQDR